MAQYLPCSPLYVIDPLPYIKSLTKALIRSPFPKDFTWRKKLYLYILYHTVHTQREHAGMANAKSLQGLDQTCINTPYAPSSVAAKLFLHFQHHVDYTAMSEGTTAGIFHSDDIKPEYLDDQLPGKPVAPTSGLERAATNNERHPVHHYNSLQKFRHAFREPLAEFLGTLVLVMFGDGVVAQTILSGGSAGNQTTCLFSWAAAVFLGYGVSAGISGGHLNPGVTLSAAVFRQFPWRKVPGYIFAQFFGGYLGALIMYAVYQPAVDNFEGRGIRTVTGETASAGIFCTFPQPFLSTRAQVTSELVTSALLQLGIFSMTDPHNAPLGNSFPFGLFVLLYGVGSSYGYLTGYAINLARDFGPRLAAATVGYPREMFTFGHHYFWVPVVIPIIGCLLGAFIYDLFIYQGLDSPLNQPDFGFAQSVQKMQTFQMKDMRPDFDIQAYHSKRDKAEENENENENV